MYHSVDIIRIITVKAHTINIILSAGSLFFASKRIHSENTHPKCILHLWYRANNAMLMYVSCRARKSMFVKS